MYRISACRFSTLQTNMGTTAEIHLVREGTTTPAVDLTVRPINVPSTPSAVSDAGGIVNFNLGSGAPDTLEIEVSGTAIATQTFTSPIIEGEANTVELEVVV